MVIRAGLCAVVALAALLPSGAAMADPAGAPGVKAGPPATAATFAAVPVVGGSVKDEPARSGGTYRPLTGPGAFFISSSSIVDLMPEKDIIWIWVTLPTGCVGLGSPRAICDIDSDEFQV